MVMVPVIRAGVVSGTSATGTTFSGSASTAAAVVLAAFLPFLFSLVILTRKSVMEALVAGVRSGAGAETVAVGTGLLAAGLIFVAAAVALSSNELEYSLPDVLDRLLAACECEWGCGGVEWMRNESLDLETLEMSLYTPSVKFAAASNVTRRTD